MHIHSNQQIVEKTSFPEREEESIATKQARFHLHVQKLRLQYQIGVSHCQA